MVDHAKIDWRSKTLTLVDHAKIDWRSKTLTLLELKKRLKEKYMQLQKKTEGLKMKWLFQQA